MTVISLKSWNRTEVRCLSGYRANERPIWFLVHDTGVDVRAILESWREPDHIYFKVRTEDGRVYELRHHEYEDYWEARQSEQRQQR